MSGFAGAGWAGPTAVASRPCPAPALRPAALRRRWYGLLGLPTWQAPGCPPGGARARWRGVACLALIATLASAGAVLPHPARAAGPPLGLSCSPYPGGATICSGEVPSFDGAPMDVDVTLPMSTSRPLHPLMVMLHGFGNNKHEWESTSDTGDGADKYHWNNDWFAEHGYYVLTYTARGFRDDGSTGAYEPGTPSGMPPPDCGQPNGSSCPSRGGTIRVKSTEVEILDTQYLAALTAAAFPGVDPGEIAVTGGSYGGGESWLQAAQPDWTAFATSHPELPALHLQVAVPKYPWTDLAYSLAPNGHGGGADGHDLYASAQGAQGGSDLGIGNPFGVAKASYILGLTTLGIGNGTLEQGTSHTPQTDQSDSEAYGAWLARVAAGEPYSTLLRTDDPTIGAIRTDFTRFHSAYYQPGWATQAAAAKARTGREAAVFSISGWTDDLFPPVESFRMFKYLKSLDSLWPVAVAVADVGHSRAQDNPKVWQRLNGDANQFLAANIEGSHRQQTTVSSQPTVCDTDAATADLDNTMAQRLTATTPEGLASGTLSVGYGVPAVLTPTSGAGDPNGLTTDAIVSGRGCKLSSGPTTPSGGYTATSAPLLAPRTLVGIGHVNSPYLLTSLGTHAVVAERVWDVAPDGTALLVSRGVYRFDFVYGDPPTGTVNVPLYGNHWVLEAGHRVRLDLEQVDAPTYRQPTGATATVQLTSPTLMLPTRESTQVTLSAG